MKSLISQVIAYSPFLAALLAFVTCVLPSRLGVRGRAVWAFVLLLAASRSVVFKHLGGNLFLPDFPQAVIWGWYFACSALYVFIALRLFWWTPRGRLTLMPAIAVALTAYGAWEGFKAPSVREIELSYPSLPAQLDGYRIAQISDIHCSSAALGWRTRAIADAANAAKPDLVCLTGDFVDGLVAKRADDLRPLFGLRAKDGVLWVTGNHEYYLDALRWRDWYRQNGARFLSNEWTSPRPGLVVAGVNDPDAVRRRLDVGPDVAGAFRGSSTNDFRILLSHRPKTFRENVKKGGFDLQLSGHTHGGIAPGIAWVVAKMNGGFVRGLYAEGGAKLYVNPGAGQWAGCPLRFFNPSEITLFVLRRK